MLTVFTYTNVKTSKILCCVLGALLAANLSLDIDNFPSSLTVMRKYNKNDWFIT
jgi:hypothetical protein